LYLILSCKLWVSASISLYRKGKFLKGSPKNEFFLRQGLLPELDYYSPDAASIVSSGRIHPVVPGGGVIGGIDGVWPRYALEQIAAMAEDLKPCFASA
jgi:hypothetical protein